MNTENIQLDQIYTSKTFPVNVTKKISNQFYVYVPIVTEKNVMNDYVYKYVLMHDYEYNYKNLVSFIIYMKYTNSDTIAILSNYMVDPQNEKYIKEYNDFQNWRKFAKDYAKKHFNLV
jgi:hypothetical protein